MIVFVNYPFDAEVREPDELLSRYATLTGFAEAVSDAANEPVVVVQRFGRDAERTRQGVSYRFVGDARPARKLFWVTSGRAADVVAGLRPRIVHFHGLVYPLAVRQLRRRLPRSTPLLVQDHGGIHARSAGFGDWRWRIIHRFGLRAATGFLFTASAQAEPWRRAGILSADQPAHEIPEASATIARPAVAAAAGDVSPTRLPGRPALLWVGRLNANKDPLTVLDGFERALAGAPDAQLSMVFGTDDLLREVQSRLTRSPGLAGRVHLLGRVAHSAMPALYQGADILVLGSHHEGGAYAVVEALAFGVTPVVTDIPAFRALTGDGRIGQLFPVGDSARLAEAISRAVAAGAGQPRSTIRDHFERQLSWTAIGRRCVEIYQESENQLRTGHLAR